MKKVTYLLIFILFACMSNNDLTNEDKDQIFNQLKLLQNWHGPKESTIYWREKVKKWVLHDGSAKVVSDEYRLELIKEKIESLEALNITTSEYMKKLNKSLGEFDTVNLGVLLTNSKLGDNICKVISEQVDINVTIWDDWMGDEEYLNMSDKEFDEFLKTRIISESKNKAVYIVPYFEISIRNPSLTQRDKYVYAFHFIKSKENKWLLNNINIELMNN